MCTWTCMCACIHIYILYVHSFITCIHIAHFVSVSTFTKIQTGPFSFDFEQRTGNSIRLVYLELTFWSWRARQPGKPIETKVTWRPSNTRDAWVTNARLTRCTRSTLVSRRSRISFDSRHPKSSISLKEESNRNERYKLCG